MKRITFITGYYGSGKTEIALNLAIQKKIETVIDLDIINPYFRSRENEKILNEKGIQIVSSGKEQSMYTDLPYISKEVFTPFHATHQKAIYDLGGNDVGAKLLRQFEDFTEMIDLFLVVNIYRPETQTRKQIIELVQKIESIGGRRITGLVNNTNLLKETTKEIIIEGQQVLREVSAMLKLPIVYTCVPNEIVHEKVEADGELLPLTIYLRKSWY